MGAQLSGRPSWAGLPSATYQVGAALAAIGWGHAMDRFGRRPALAQGWNDFLMGAAAATGSLGSGWAFATVGYGAMGMVAAAAALVPFVLAWRLPRPLRPAAA